MRLIPIQNTIRDHILVSNSALTALPRDETIKAGKKIRFEIVDSFFKRGRDSTGSSSGYFANTMPTTLIKKILIIARKATSATSSIVEDDTILTTHSLFLSRGQRGGVYTYPTPLVRHMCAEG